MSISSSFLIAAAYFGGIGTFFGYLFSKKSSIKPRRNGVIGTIYRDITEEGEKILFSTNTGFLIDLKTYSKAKTPTETQPIKEQSLWRGIAKGLALSLGMGVGIWAAPEVLFVLSLFIAPYIFGSIGGKLTRHNNFSGNLVGGALGFLLILYIARVSSMIAAASGVGVLLPIWFVVLGLLGAIIGAALHKPLQRAKAWKETYHPNSQWWTRISF